MPKPENLTGQAGAAPAVPSEITRAFAASGQTPLEDIAEAKRRMFDPPSAGAGSGGDVVGRAGAPLRVTCRDAGRFRVVPDSVGDLAELGPAPEGVEYIRESELARIPVECQGPLPAVGGLAVMSSMAWWWPRIVAACARSGGRLAAPETALLGFAPGEGGWGALTEFRAMETWNEPAWWGPLVELVSREVVRLGFPAFLRGEFVGGGDTGEGVVRRLAEVPARIAHLVERHELERMVGPRLERFAVRRWLNAELGAGLAGCRAFRAFGPGEEGGPGEPLVIGREANVVVEDGRVVSAGPFWHPDWLRGEDATPDAADWEERLRGLNDWPGESRAALLEAAALAGAALADSGVAWVVEFLWASDQSGAARWWVTDARPAALTPTPPEEGGEA